MKAAPIENMASISLEAAIGLPSQSRRGSFAPLREMDLYSLAHLAPRQITVVEYDPLMQPVSSHPVGRRYRTLFGDAIDWNPEGLDKWLPFAAAAQA